MLLGQQLAGGVDRRAGDMGVDVDAAGHDDHPPWIGRECAGTSATILRRPRRRRAPRGRCRWRGRRRGLRRCAASQPPAIAASTSAAAARSPSSSARSGTGTPSMRCGARDLDALGRGGEDHACRPRRLGIVARVDDHGRQLAQPQAAAPARLPSTSADRLAAVKQRGRAEPPGFARGWPRAKLTAAGNPVCQARTSSAPRALPSRRTASVTACRSRLRSRTSEKSASASTRRGPCKKATWRAARRRSARSSIANRSWRSRSSGAPVTSATATTPRSRARRRARRTHRPPPLVPGSATVGDDESPRPGSSRPDAGW